jgi:hypothetical protein
MLNFSEHMFARNVSQKALAETHREKARSLIEDIKALPNMHPGDVAAQFRYDQRTRLQEDARRLEIEAKICERRVEFLNQGYLPNGPDEMHDVDWMQQVQPIFGQAHAAGIVKSTKDKMRDWM